MNKNINQKGFGGSILILLIVVSIIGYFSYKALIQEGDNPQTEGIINQLDKAEEIAKVAKERAEKINEELGEYVEEKIKKENKINVSLKINTGDNINSYAREVEDDISVFDLMKIVEDKHSDFSFSYQDSSLGVFIDEIQEKKNNTKDNIYWMFYINDKLSEVGASQYIVVDNDVIEWKYEDASDLW